jgi:hypothetical protein
VSSQLEEFWLQKLHTFGVCPKSVRYSNDEAQDVLLRDQAQYAGG